MGRGKIEIKRIENNSNRQVTYSKRRTGIIKKAKEITVLCDAQVSLIIFGTSGRMHEYCSPSATLPDLLDKYHKNCSQRLWDAKHENLSKEVDRIKKENDSMQIQLRHLKGEDITSMQHRELIDIEDTLENGLTRLRQKQSEYHKMRQIRIKETEEEHRELSYIYAMHKQEEELQKARQYDSQMPFAFRVQPMQPNLQERM